VFPRALQWKLADLQTGLAPLGTLDRKDAVSSADVAERALQAASRRPDPQRCT
jgi:hypothetical protein